MKYVVDDQSFEQSLAIKHHAVTNSIFLVLQRVYLYGSRFILEPQVSDNAIPA
jgi:hypothetical protein